LEPPTLDWFWGQYNLYLWESLPPAEKARQVRSRRRWRRRKPGTRRPVKPVMPHGKGGGGALGAGASSCRGGVQ
ncbi:hypothetical protein T12_12797, partial [Trichinella patagoniensis]